MKGLVVPGVVVVVTGLASLCAILGCSILQDNAIGPRDAANTTLFRLSALASFRSAHTAASSYEFGTGE